MAYGAAGVGDECIRHIQELLEEQEQVQRVSRVHRLTNQKSQLRRLFNQSQPHSQLDLLRTASGHEILTPRPNHAQVDEFVDAASTHAHARTRAHTHTHTLTHSLILTHCIRGTRGRMQRAPAADCSLVSARGSKGRFPTVDMGTGRRAKMLVRERRRRADRGGRGECRC